MFSGVKSRSRSIVTTPSLPDPAGSTPATGSFAVPVDILASVETAWVIVRDLLVGLVDVQLVDRDLGGQIDGGGGGVSSGRMSRRR